MKLLVVLMMVGCACASIAPQQHDVDILEQSHPVEGRNWLVDQAVNVLVNQAFNYLRRIINNGSVLMGIPPLDPLELEKFHLYIPAGLINLDMNLTDVYATGFGGFQTRRSRLNIRTLLLELDIVVPHIYITCKYDLLGDFFTAIPVYGKGNGKFIVEGFNFRANFHLKQSDDGKSVVIDNIDNIFFEIPDFKSNMTGMLGGGEELDSIVNAIIEEVIFGYVTRFRGAIGIVAGHVVTAAMNPVLESFDTWRFVAPFV